MSKILCLLIIEDSEDDALLEVRMFQNAGYEVRFERVEIEEEMDAALRKEKWDIIISDYSMPHFSGLAALRVLQRTGLDIPFIIVSGKMGEDVAVEAMKSGAQDYMMKNDLKRLVVSAEHAMRALEDRRELKQAEEKIRRAEHQLRSYIDHAGDAIYVIDCLNGRIIDCNQRACLDLGYSRRELLQLSAKDIEADFHLGAINKIHRSISPERKALIEGVHKRKDGSAFPVELRFSFPDSAEPQNLICIARDIAERKKAEEQFERFFSLTPDLMCIASTDGYFKRINSAWSEILGYTEQEILAAPFLELIHPEDRDATLQQVARQVAGEATIQFTNRYRGKDGVYRWLEWRATPAVDKTILFASARDITDRKQTEQRFRESAETWERTFDAISDLIFIQDKDMNIVKINKACADVLKMDAKDIIGKKCFEIMHHLDHPWMCCPFEKTRQDKTVHTEEVDDPRLGIFLQVTVSPLLDANGELAGAVHIARDITERKKVEEERQAHFQELEIFYKASVGREERILELKEEISGLNEELVKFKKGA